MKTSFTEDMKNMREKLGFSQIQISENTGIGRTTLSMIENGRRLPTRKQFKILNKYLGFSQIGTDESLKDDISDLINDLQIFELLQVINFIKNKFI